MRKSLYILIAIAIPVFARSTLCWAVDPTSGTVLQPALIHTAPKSSELPFPGKPLNLLVRVENSKSFDLRIRALVVRDGVLQDVPIGNPAYDKSDKVIYSGTIPSPLESLSYQFVLYGEGGKVNVTSRYSISRQCIPDVTLTSLEAESFQDTNSIESNINKAEGLKRDIQEYEEAVALLDSLQGALK